MRGTYTPCSDSLSLRLPHHGLTSPHTSTRRLILQKARHHTTPHKENAGALTACRHMVSGTISQPLTGALFTFPSRYSSTIGHQGYLGLPHGHGRFTRNFTGSVLLGTTLKEDAQVSPTGLSPSTVGHPKPVRLPKRFITPRRPGRTSSRTIPQPRERNTRRL